MAIIDLSGRFEEFFNLLILTIFVSTLFILCFVMYHASLVRLNAMKISRVIRMFSVRFVDYPRRSGFLVRGLVGASSLLVLLLG